MIVYVDIDGTIAETQGLEYHGAVPIKERIDKINAMYDRGDKVFYWTARGSVTGKDFRNITELQLQAWGCKHHGLIMGKPAFDLYICDKVMNVLDL